MFICDIFYYFCIVISHKKTLASKAKFLRLSFNINRLWELDENKTKHEN